MKFFGSLLAALVLLGGGTGGIWALTKYGGLQTSLIWTAVAGAIAWSVRSSAEKKRENERLLVEEKRGQYYKFIEFFSKMSSDEGRAEIDKNPSLLRQWSLNLILIGSDDVITTWNHARTAWISLGEEQAQMTDEAKRIRTASMFRWWGEFLMAMRRDCGHAGTKLSITDTLGTFINDVESYRALLEAPDTVVRALAFGSSSASSEAVDQTTARAPAGPPGIEPDGPLARG
jgi:hypothetical protein